MGGAFVGLDKTVAERTTRSSIGFGAPLGSAAPQPQQPDSASSASSSAGAGGASPALSAAARAASAHAAATDALLSRAEPADLVRYGLIPEFVGRFPVVVALSALDEAAMQRILTQPRHAISKQFAELLAPHGATLRLRPCALKAVASEAVRRGTGARGLRSIMETVLLQAQFTVPGAQPPIVRVDVSGESVVAALSGTGPGALLLTAEQLEAQRAAEAAAAAAAGGAADAGAGAGAEADEVVPTPPSRPGGAKLEDGIEDVPAERVAV